MGVDDGGGEAEIAELMYDIDLAFGGFTACGFDFGEVDVVEGHEDHTVGKAGEGRTGEFYGEAAFLLYGGDELAFEELFVHRGLGLGVDKVVDTTRSIYI